MNLVEGWTERIVYQLFSDGVAQPLTGGSVQLRVRTQEDSPVTFSGTVGILDAAAGKVYFDPTSTDIVTGNSPLKVRFRFTDSAGKVSFFPNSETPEYWVVSSA